MPAREDKRLARLPELAKSGREFGFSEDGVKLSSTEGMTLLLLLSINDMTRTG